MTAVTRLGELERAVMDVLWNGEVEFTAVELRDELPGRDLATTTVLTVLSRLESKGMVARERGRRPHVYRALSTRADHVADLMREVLGTAPDRDAVLARFVGTVSGEEAATLRRLLDGDPGGDE